MQYPRELIPFIQFLIDHNVQSYLEIGIKNGGLITFLADLLPLERIYACDINRPEILDGYPNIEFFQGSSHSWAYRRWRKQLGHIDLVLIDADHTYKGAKKDWRTENTFQNRYIALHDINNPGYPELRKLWIEEIDGEKAEFINDRPEETLINLTHRESERIERYIKNYGTTCGIGIRWNP